MDPPENWKHNQVSRLPVHGYTQELRLELIGLRWQISVSLVCTWLTEGLKQI